MESVLTNPTAVWHLVVLALVQGITEFLPISSSGHLILVPKLTGWVDQGLGLDVAMHIGTLAAVVLYFHRDMRILLGGARDMLSGRQTAAARLLWQLALATVPVVLAGFLLQDLIAEEWRSAALIAFTTAAFGILLWLADRKADRASATVTSLTWRTALIIGIAQAVALIPGVSRSGITMTAALFLGLTRPESARFSLLLSIPTTAAAGTLATIEMIRAGDSAAQDQALLAGLLAFGCAFLAIAGLMRWLKQASFRPFVIYRLLLAALLVTLLLSGWL